MNSEEYRLETRLIHDVEKYEQGSVNQPIYQTTSFCYPDPESLASVFQGEKAGYVYSRLSNPTHAAFEKKMAGMEGGIGAVSCASGMSAVTTVLLGLLQEGDEVIAANRLFGGTYSFLTENLPNWGIKVRFVDAVSPEAYRSAINPQTRLIFCESMGNPRLEIPDIEGIALVAHEAGIPLVVDNTLLTPCMYRPGEYGADIIVHSTSKYINGNASAIGGVIIDTGNMDWEFRRFPRLEEYAGYGRFVFLAYLRKEVYKRLGGCSSPFDSYLNLHGLETLALRVKRHSENAFRLARFLDDHPAIRRVYYPGLSSHPQHELAVENFGGDFGGIVSFELSGREECFRVLAKLKLALNVSNLGDVRTLVVHPASTILSDLDQAQMRNLGVNSGLIRVSVGIEHSEDIIGDFKQALSSLQ